MAFKSWLTRKHLAKAVALGGTVALLAVGLPACVSNASSGSDTVTFGVSGPLTGINAEYGGFWKKGFKLAVDDVNASGGIDGKKLKLQWQDSQSDPKQAVTVAQKFVDDSSVIAELGDFSSSASMAATSIYQRAGLVQYGFTNSAPAFTQGGTVAFAPTLSQEALVQQQLTSLAKVGKNVAVLYQNTDWGAAVYKVYQKKAPSFGIKTVHAASYLPTSTDFRSLINSARGSKPDVVYILGYDPDESAIIKQLRGSGWDDVKIFAQQFSATAINLTGKYSEGVYTTNTWWPSDSSPASVKEYVAKFKKAYGTEPNQFEVMSYDAVKQLAAAAKQGGATREGVLKGLKADKKLPSVQYGAFAFDSQRRPPYIPATTLVVHNKQQSIVK